MAFDLKLVEVGDSLGVVLPDEVLAALRLKEGDSIHLVQSPDGFRLSSHGPEFAEQRELGPK